MLAQNCFARPKARKFFSRKGAKAPRNLRNAAALCAFAPLREKFSRIYVLFVQSPFRRSGIYSQYQFRKNVAEACAGLLYQGARRYFDSRVRRASAIMHILEH